MNDKKWEWMNQIKSELTKKKVNGKKVKVKKQRWKWRNKSETEWLKVKVNEQN